VCRNELYNAYGAISDREERLRLVSPCSIDKTPNWTQDGTIFAELGKATHHNIIILLS
jgi:hypothetical protein